MDSNSRFTVRKLPDGNVLLCDSQGTPVLVDAQGRIRLDHKGQPMTYQDNKLRQNPRIQVEEYKVPLAQYKEEVERLYKPRLNLRSQQIEMNGREIVVACMNFNFIGGSMGSVVGEKISRAMDHSLKTGAPFLMISKSGGARMMEAAFSLMQMS